MKLPPDPAAVRVHAESHLTEGGQCVVCGLLFTDGEGGLNHVLSHVGVQLYACAMCHAHFSSRAKLLRHTNRASASFSIPPAALSNSAATGPHCELHCAQCGKTLSKDFQTMSAQEHNHSLGFNNDTLWFIYKCTIELDTNNRRVALFLLYLLIFVAGLLENLLVLWVNWRRRHSANGVLFCVLNVSLSDTMMVVTLPFYMMEVTMDKVWLWGRFLCRVTNLIYVVNFYSSSFFLALMTLERYLSLTKPAFPALFPAVGRRRWWLCAGVWLLSLFLALLENAHVDLLEWDEPGCYMLPEQNYSEWYASVAFLKLIFQFLFPSAVIITCNVLIGRAVRAAPDAQDPRDVWLVHVYSLVFVLCWFPFHLVMFLIIIDDLVNQFLFSCNGVEVLYFTFTIVEVLTLFHCVANPILYNFLGKSFRSDLTDTVARYIDREGNAAQLTGAPAEAETQREISTGQSDVDS
uniref:G protein-coupled receptor 182 n=1 Tax=Neogobius melanostomus TaxID=47308 RepID=A0A8C6TY86_9GOBI